MEPSVSCNTEDVLTPSGDDEISRMSVISVESLSPASGVHSVNSSAAEELEDYMVDIDDIDADGKDEVIEENDPTDTHRPVLDTVQCGADDKVASSEDNGSCGNDCASEDLAASVSQCDTDISLCETSTFKDTEDNLDSIQCSSTTERMCGDVSAVGNVIEESAATERNSYVPTLKKTSKKTLSELHKELLKKAENLSISASVEPAVNSEDSSDVQGSGDTTQLTAAVTEVSIGSGSDKLLEGEADVISSEGTNSVYVDHACAKCERSKSRKAAKPVKRGPEPAMEFVEIRPAENLHTHCSLCSYTCCSTKQLDLHCTEVHRSGNNLEHSAQPYRCQLCSWFGSSKEAYERHVAHHPGQHVVRYHTCPYCLFSTTEMPMIESHLPLTHTTENFRFEVLQYNISYKQNLVECPVCQGLYQWQQDLLCHIRECHSLESLASYMESTFSDQTELTTMSVPKEMFNDLLDRYAAGSMMEDTETELSMKNVEDSASPWTMNVVATTQRQASDIGTVVRFHCSSCDFNSEDFDLFRKHCASHSSSAADNRDSSGHSAAIPVKSGIRNTYHCHLCPFECSKMVHYRRHLEIHERNQSLAEGFRCGYCHFAHYRQNCVKFHLGKYHGDRPIKMSRITDGVEVELSETDLFALRSRRTPTDIRSQQALSSSSSASVLVLRSNEEKRPTNRYKYEGSIPLLAIERPSPATPRSSHVSPKDKTSAVSDQRQGSLAELEESNRLLDEFEQSLPGSMIYPDPIKCPRCDFTNRVRVNMIRHLKLHRDEDSALFGMANSQPVDDLKVDTERPLLRQILSEKSPVSKTEVTSSFDDTESNGGSSIAVGPEAVQERTTQSTPQDYSEFCAKLTNSDLFQCHRCRFTHRFPSKVKRHYHYRHSSVAPYKCGHCRFEAVERGKVVKHWQIMHRSLPMLVIQQESGISADAASTPKSTDNCDSNSQTNNAHDLPDMNLNLSAIVKEEPIDYDSEAPALDYYPINDRASTPGDDKKSTTLTSVKSKSSVMTRSRSSLESDNSLDQLVTSRGGRMCRRQFQCAYCGVVSRWNRRDICLHVMHVHLQRRVFTCRHCSFGNSKSKMLVRAHCVKFHPNRVVSVRDDTNIVNAITAVEEKDGVVTVAFAPNGSAIMTSDELQDYMARNKLGSVPLAVNKNKTAAPAPPQPKSCDESPAVGESHKFNLRLRSADKEPSNKQSVTPEANVTSSKARWKCRLCGFANERIGRVKYHIICRHLNLKPFSCPHCHLYLWKMQAVESHIDRCHPGMERRVVAAVDEMASYLKRNVEQVVPGAASDVSSNKPAVIVPAPTPNVISMSSNKPTYFRCKLCGFQDVRNDKTKYHIVKQHLKLRQFSCPYCHLYLWGRQQVARHVEEKHPGYEVRIQRTFQEYEQFLRNNVCKVEVAGNSPAVTQSGPLSPSATVSGDQLVAYQRSTTLVARLPCDLCSFVTDSEMSLSAHRRSHRLYQCMHCRFRHTLVAKVQSHCLSMHPTLPVQYKQWTPSSLSALNSSADHQIDSVDIKDEVGNCLKFYPCDFCPSHFGTQSALDGHLNLVHSRVYSCQLCGLTSSSREDLEMHSIEEHPGEAVVVTLIPSENAKDYSGSRTGVKRMAANNDEDGVELGREAAKRQKIDSSMASENSLSLYKCRLCPYSCYKVTVMRHHVMSHLRYHPYMCPYCNVLRSVKSFPVKKHIRIKHPGKEERFLFVQNKVLENKVEKSFYHIPANSVSISGTRDGSHVENNDDDSQDQPPQLEREVEPVKLTIGLSSPQLGQHKVLYRCMMCGLKTHIRMDMRHHLMREIHYKPFKCVHCTYTEPCRWSMRKHFRTKHIGLDVAVTDMRDPEQDERIERMLEDCTIPLKDLNDHDLRIWKPRSSSPQRSTANRMNEKAPSAASDLYASSMPEPCQIGATSPTNVALKLHRCPHCLYTNSNLKLLRSHMVKHGPCRLRCAYCDHKGHYPSRIYKHIRRHHPGRTFRVVKVPNEEQPKVLPRVDLQPRPHKPSKPFPGQVFLDGVALDISLNADEGGWFRCHECGYQSMNREHYKMHVVIHRPPKWQCFYCDQKYPLIFRLRRHSNQKHPHLPIKWIDLSTGEVCFDPQKMPTSAADSVSNAATEHLQLQPRVRQPTARKSTTGRRMMQVALFRSAKFSSRSKATSDAAERHGGDNGDDDMDARSDDDGDDAHVNGDLELDMTDNDCDKDEIDSDNSSENNDGDGSSSSAVYIDCDEDVANGTYIHSDVLRFCCHLCSFSVCALSPSALANHLNREHRSDLCCLPAVEILDFDTDIDDGSTPMTLRRCGFCSYESYVESEFDEHMLSMHNLSRPLRCNRGCMYATFSRLQMHAHFAETHPREPFSVSPLDKPYSMLPYEDESTEDNDDILVSFSAKVLLEDIFELPDSDFDAFLSAHGAWY